MNCKEVEELLLEDVSEAGFEPVRLHLEACSACRSLYLELRQIEELSDKLARGQGAPEEFTDCVLEKAVSRRKGWRFPLKPAAALSACLLAVLGVAWVFQAPGEATAAERAAGPEATAVSEAAGHEGGDYIDVYFHEHPSQEPRIVRLPATIEVKARQVDYARASTY